MADLLDFQRGHIVGGLIVGASVKNRWMICSSKEYCLKSNHSIWERRKNLLTEAKVWKKAKDVW